MRLEDRHARRANDKHFAQALGNGVKFRVAKEPPRVLGKQILFYSQPHEAITWVACARIREAPVMGQKGDAVQPVQQREDFLVGHSQTPHLAPDLSHHHTQLSKQFALVVGEILVEQIHAVTSSRSR